MHSISSFDGSQPAREARALFAVPRPPKPRGGSDADGDDMQAFLEASVRRGLARKSAKIGQAGRSARSVGPPQDLDLSARSAAPFSDEFCSSASIGFVRSAPGAATAASDAISFRNVQSFRAFAASSGVAPGVASATRVAPPSATAIARSYSLRLREHTKQRQQQQQDGGDAEMMRDEDNDVAAQLHHDAKTVTSFQPRNRVRELDRLLNVKQQAIENETAMRAASQQRSGSRRRSSTWLAAASSSSRAATGLGVAGLIDKSTRRKSLLQGIVTGADPLTVVSWARPFHLLSWTQQLDPRTRHMAQVAAAQDLLLVERAIDARIEQQRRPAAQQQQTMERVRSVRF